jgi:hypothetical protein
MRRIAGLLALMLTAALLSGCVYDPYTGTYAPCCGYYGYSGYYGYRSPYYRYPPSYAPYGYPSGPYMAPPQGQPGGYPQGPGQPPPRPGAAASPAGGGGPAQPLVARNLDAIDADRNGYVTLVDGRGFAVERSEELRQHDQPSVQ